MMFLSSTHSFICRTLAVLNPGKTKMSEINPLPQGIWSSPLSPELQNLELMFPDAAFFRCFLALSFNAVNSLQ